MDQMVLTKSAGTGTRVMWRRDDRGRRYRTEVEGDDYQTPAKGQYRLMLHGIAEPFEQDNRFRANAKVVKTRIEFKVVKARNGGGAGKLFTSMYTFSLNEKSNMGRLANALRGGIEEGTPLRVTNLIGTVFDGYVTNSEDGKYADVSVETIERVQPAPFPDEPLGDEAGNDGANDAGTPESDGFWNDGDSSGANVGVNAAPQTDAEEPDW